METSTLIVPAGVALADVVRNVRPDQLDEPTPCPDWTVRQLVNHLMFWAPVMERAARKDPVRPLSDLDQDLVVDDWRERCARLVDALAEAWSQPDAWIGTSRMTGPESPAAMFGGMVLCEFVLHGWDLARATGQELACAEATALGTYAVVEPMLVQGRSMGVFGPEVAVPETAPELWRVVAVSGRDPNWRA
ncbi:TIGR03086 family metal-binding protein [Rugosimonospora africana]|uniref:TIGR03086 family protein n=1 Tax=Rugosimonospora africana TaxID=556532 RepID=A0A8J3R404_9ACTN|nr:TIGR03086 family metal-binding protein [Rugosimonospora africana]GIH21062.1 TIGR03086 family protein [Rugosimonospora africana]